MSQMLKEDFPRFLESYQRPLQAGVRANTLKVTPGQLASALPWDLAPIPWASNGFFVDGGLRPSTHPFFTAGAYYLQEPSAMAPAQLLPVEPGDLVLDVCAAPGGKATELAARLQGRGFLVANDVSNSRAKALLNNLERFGVANMAVTSEPVAHLAQAFPETFDKVLLDAPCSGEGMFHKDMAIAAAWEKTGPEHYAEIQRGLILNAADMLKPGGYLLYSTCTFNTLEDEGTVEHLLGCRPEFRLVNLATPERLAMGFAPGFGSCAQALRVFPHLMNGEGHFIALLQKGQAEDGPPDAKPARDPRLPRDAKPSRDPKVPRDPRSSRDSRLVPYQKLPQEVRDFFDQLRFDSDLPWRDEGLWQIRGESLYYLAHPELAQALVKYLRCGLLAGQIKKGRFEPFQPLAMALPSESYPRVLRLQPTDPRIQAFLRGETLTLSDQEHEYLAKRAARFGAPAQGWMLVCVEGLPLGWGKVAGQVVKNKLASGWRQTR